MHRDDPISLGELKAAFTKEYVSAGDLIKEDLYEIISFCLDIKPFELTLYPSKLIKKELLFFIRDLVQRRINKEPLDYIFGFKSFYGLKMHLSKDVLIPRHETEILVDKIKSRFSSIKPSVILDLCCGSGCLGLALKKVFPAAKVFLSDISFEAIEIAKTNAKTEGLEVECVCSDLTTAVKEKKLVVDLVVCNPPYISELEYESLEKEVKDYEPKLALLSGKTGFELYERLATELLDITAKGSLVAFEIGSGQKEGLQNIFSSPLWGGFCCEKDYAGHDRFIFLERES